VEADMTQLQDDLFLGYVMVVATLAGAAAIHYLHGPGRLVAVSILAFWLVYAGALGFLGVARDQGLRPPGILYLVGPAVLLVLSLARSAAGGNLARSVPLAILLGFQGFRVGVEAALHALWQSGLAPHLLTLAGGNVEILVGATAPAAAWLSTRGRLGERLAFAWTVLGSLSLLNVIARAMLTAPGPLHGIDTEVPNVGLGLFPYSFIPGFMAPFAMLLHVLAFRALAARRDPVRRPRHGAPASVTRSA
jgi:hypothetical protein